MSNQEDDFNPKEFQFLGDEVDELIVSINDTELKENFSLKDSCVPNDEREIAVCEIPHTNSNQRRIEDIPKLHSTIYEIPLLPKPISISLLGMKELLLEQSGIKGNSKTNDSNIFAILNPEQPQGVIYKKTIDIESEHSHLRTNLPFLAFHLKIGSSDRYYLYYTLADQVHSSYTKSNYNVFVQQYLEVFHEQSSKSVIELGSASCGYELDDFLNDSSNNDYFSSVTLLSEFQNRLSEITGVKELGYIQPNLLQFQEYKDSGLKLLLENSKKGIFDFIESCGRIDYKAHTHVGVKPLFAANKVIPHISELREVYWLNTNNYYSSGESLTPDEDINEIVYFTENGYWKPSLEELMKIGFADYMCFKTYRPTGNNIPSSLKEFSLPFFSMMYLIDFVGRGEKILDITQTTAYSLLLYICNKKQYIRHKYLSNHAIDLTSDLAQMSHDYIPENIGLPLQTSSYFGYSGWSKSKADRVELFEFPDEYKNYSINPIEFIPYLENAYKSLVIDETDLEFGCQKKFNKVFKNALSLFIVDYRRANYFISKIQIEDMINSLCIVHGVDKSLVYTKFQVPERMYLKEFNTLIILIKNLANTKYDIHQ